MIKSWCIDENPKAEWKDIREPSHVAKIHAALDRNFPKYFDSLVHPAPTSAAGADLFDRLGEKFKVTKSAKPIPEAKADGAVFVKALADFDKLAQRYCNIFNGEVLQDYRDDDPDAFKTELSRKFPVIMSLLQAKSTELKDWKIKYNQVPSEELLCVFENLLAFAGEYVGQLGVEKTYSKLRAASEFGLDDFDSEAMSIQGVVGSGIKSLPLYHLHPRVFPVLSGRGVFALYFLTDKSAFSLRSKTSEFLIVNDGLEGRDLNMRMDHNYWYPYSLFAEYAMQTANSMQAACTARGIAFDLDYRYVYVDAYFRHVGELHAADLKVMAGLDELRWASK